MHICTHTDYRVEFKRYPIDQADHNYTGQMDLSWSLSFLPSALALSSGTA